MTRHIYDEKQKMGDFLEIIKQSIAMQLKEKRKSFNRSTLRTSSLLLQILVKFHTPMAFTIDSINELFFIAKATAIDFGFD